LGWAIEYCRKDRRPARLPVDRPPAAIVGRASRRRRRHAM
jgi:hypothetical protein